MILNGQTFNWSCTGNYGPAAQCSAGYKPPICTQEIVGYKEEYMCRTYIIGWKKVPPGGIYWCKDPSDPSGGYWCEPILEEQCGMERTDPIYKTVCK